VKYLLQLIINNMDKNFKKSSEPVTMEELNQLHDEWWASLTDEDKERLYNEMVESEVQYYSDKTDQ
tara:strand:+ start:441 stop:638 length:198 start_codon:yes stop_codon:yes gene_type:complete